MKDVPRYFEPYVHDCFNNCYAAVIQHMGYKPQILLADYLSLMFDEESELLGANFMFRYSVSVEFTEEELNTSFEYAYLPQTSLYVRDSAPSLKQDLLNISMYILDDPIEADARLRELLRRGKPVVLLVDLFYMPFHRAYQKDHGLHAIVVTGFDDATDCYMVFDKYLLSSSDFDGMLAKDDLWKGRASQCPRYNPISGHYDRPIRHLWMEFDTTPYFQVTAEKNLAMLKESWKRMTGQRMLLGQPTGLERLEKFRHSLQKQKELTEIDERRIYFWRDYYNTILKRLARGRNRFKVFVEEIAAQLPPGAETVASHIGQSAKHWDIAANLFLKLAITKKLALLDDIDRQLAQVAELEQEAMAKIADMVQVRI